MPKGKTHDKISIITIPALTIVFYLITTNLLQTVIFFVSYLFASFMFNGDLDTYSKPYNRWWLFKTFWTPYQTIFKHRSIFTHGIILGTFVRLLYLSIVIIGILWIIYGKDSLNTYYNFCIENKKILVVSFIGLEFGNSTHTFADLIF